MYRYKGIIFLLLSSFFFTTSTLFAKLVTTLSEIQAVEITFCRFFLGFITVLIYMVTQKRSLRPKRISYVLLRSILNLIAVILFFAGVQFTTITNANMLNMTYPIFVYLYAPFINREKNSVIYLLYVTITMIGAYLIINPTIEDLLLGDILALLSGVTAGAAISILREARKYDSSFIILFYLMTIGTITNYFIMLPYFIAPKGIVILYLFLSASSGVLGQIFITIGYRYIDAASGSLISSSRILFAVIMGVCMFSDPLSPKIIIGAILIIISLIGVSGRWQRIRQKTPSSMM
ncbi:MAG: DMT family transporter [Spirochaetota bacterium]|nr:DMT family transporter [Spirochaetota bacterium]